MDAAKLAPIIVTGIGRSGTSAVLRSLLHHSQVLRPEQLGEAPFIAEFVGFLSSYEDSGVDTDYRLKNYKADSKTRNELYRELILKLHVSANDLTQLEDDNIVYWPIKAFPKPHNIDKFNQIYPDANIIYIIRNGIEVVNSARHFEGFAHLSFINLCRRWRDSLKVNSFLEKHDGAELIRHEDMINNPHEVMGALWKSFGMKADDGPADFLKSNIFNSSFDETQKVNHLDIFLKRRSEAWNSWTGEEREAFIRICEPQMKRFGFDIPDNEKKKVEIPVDISPTKEGTDSSSIDSASMEFREQATTANKSSASIKIWPFKAKKTDLARIPQPLTKFMTAREVNYCLHPSLSRNFLYVETPKVACTSLKHAMQSVEAITIGVPPPPLDGSTVHVRINSPLPQLVSLEQKNIRQILYEKNYYRFCFVRNPFSRVLSSYISKVERNIGPKRFILAIKHGIHPDQVKDLKEEICFREFLEIIQTQTSYEMDIHWRPQVDQLFIDELNYDFIGRLESLNEDFATVKQKLFPDLDINLGHSKNATGTGNKFQQYYNDECIAIVQKLYARDFDKFEYSTKPG